MKRTLWLIVAVCISTNLFAIGLSVLSEEKRLEYLKNSLSINFDTVIQSSAYGSSYQGVAFARGSSTQKEFWTPYYGNQAISKADFFRIVGEEALAVNQEEIVISNKKNRTIANTFYGIGFGLTGIGLIVELLPLLSDSTKLGMTMVYAGAGIALGGLAIATIGLPFELKSNQELNVSTNFIIGLSENYNLMLYTSLTK